MCIIIAKPQGASMPPYRILENCARRNPDGFGFATVDGVYKTMKFDTFIKHLYDWTTDDDAILIHFRYATHGSCKRSNCHPFRDDETGVSFAHNGVLNIVPHGDMTDSETAFRGLILPKIRDYGLDSDEVFNEIEDIIGGSRFAFLGPDSLIRLYGNFYDFAGCMYSNPYFL